MVEALLRILVATPALLGLGLMMGFSPALYSISFVALMDDPKKLHIIRWLALGIFCGATTLIILFSFVNPQNLINSVHSETSRLLLKRSIDIAAGLLLLLAAILLWLRRNRPKKPRTVPGSHLHPAKAVLEGFLNSAIGVSSMATMYVVERTVTGVSHNALEWWIAYGTFAIAMIGPYLILEASWNKYPRFAHAMTEGLQKLKAAHLTAVLSGLLALAALVFFTLALLVH